MSVTIVASLIVPIGIVFVIFMLFELTANCTLPSFDPYEDIYGISKELKISSNVIYGDGTQAFDISCQPSSFISSQWLDDDVSVFNREDVRVFCGTKVNERQSYVIQHVNPTTSAVGYRNSTRINCLGTLISRIFTRDALFSVFTKIIILSYSSLYKHIRSAIKHYCVLRLSFDIHMVVYGVNYAEWDDYGTVSGWNSMEKWNRMYR